MHTTRPMIILAAALALFACKKEEKQPPAPTPSPVICCPTTAPTLISPSNNASITIPVTFRWTKVQGAASYAIVAPCTWTGTAGQNYSADIAQATVTDTFYVVTELPTSGMSGAQGTWKVIGLGSDNTQGPWSQERSFTIQ